MSDSRSTSVVDYFNFHWEGTSRFNAKDEKWAEGVLSDNELESLKKMVGQPEPSKLIISSPSLEFNAGSPQRYNVRISLDTLKILMDKDKLKALEWLENKAEQFKFHHDSASSCVVKEDKTKGIELVNDDQGLPAILICRGKKYKAIRSKLAETNPRIALRVDPWRERLVQLADALPSHQVTSKENPEKDQYAFCIKNFFCLYQVLREIDKNKPRHISPSPKG